MLPMTLGSHTSRKPFEMLNSHLTATYECTNLGRNAKKVRLKHLTKAPMENFEEKIILLTEPYDKRREGKTYTQ